MSTENVPNRVKYKSNNIRYESDAAIRSAFGEILLYLCFLTAATIVALSSRHLHMFYFNQAIEILFVKRDTTTVFNYHVAFEQLITTSDWWSFLESNFLDDLHEDNNETDGIFMKENRLLGPPRLRQIRVLADSCDVPRPFLKYFQTCYAEYSPSIEDKRPLHKGTTFYTIDELNTVALWGKIGWYPSGGYVQDLTYHQEKSKAILKDLINKKWIDRGTRVVVVEFAVFNANTNLFDNVKFIAELPPTGGIIPSAHVQALKRHSLWTEDRWLIKIASIVFYLFVIFFTINEIKEIINVGIAKYLCSIWNWVDCAILMLAVLSFVYNIWHPLYINQLLLRIAENSDEFQSLDVICFWNMLYMDMMAISTFFVWIKIFKFISFNKTMLQFSTTLQRCSKDLLGFGAMFLIVFLAYAQLGLLLFGTTHPDFRNFKESFLTLMRMVLGDFEYTGIEEANRILGPIYFLTYILLVFFILVNMFLAIINDTYQVVKGEITKGGNHLQTFVSNKFTKAVNCVKSLRKPKPVAQKPRVDVTLDDYGNAPARDLSQSTIFPKSVDTSEIISSEPMRVRKSDVLNSYFEEVEHPAQNNEHVLRLTNRIALLEEIMEELIGNMDRILRKVDSKKHSKQK